VCLCLVVVAEQREERRGGRARRGDWVTVGEVEMKKRERNGFSSRIVRERVARYILQHAFGATVGPATVAFACAK
jgi:hypothetical protein